MKFEPARRLVVVMIVTAWTVSACGGDTEPAATAVAPGATTVTTEAAQGPEPVEPSSTIVPELPVPPLPYGTMVLAAAGPGSNPLLEWDSVDGAVLYRLVVLDAGGRPYWAWSGSATSVHFGGNAASTVVGARVFAELVWRVSAHDDAGVPLAVSDLGSLSP